MAIFLLSLYLLLWVKRNIVKKVMNLQGKKIVISKLTLHTFGITVSLTIAVSSPYRIADK